ncbi:MAG: small multi-drug export protein [Oscillospiraceae bacterium]|nr:small multi-drug export protein [Oscillospiraceae bacterium]
MVPIIELRGALPIAEANGLSQAIAIPVAVLGNILPVPFIILFIRSIFAWIRHKLPKLDGVITRLEERALKKSGKVRESVFWGLFLFVAIPLPGTGAWTGALIAALLDLRLKKAFPAIALGVITAGIVVGLASAGVGSFFS